MNSKDICLTLKSSVMKNLVLGAKFGPRSKFCNIQHLDPRVSVNFLKIKKLTN